MCVAARPYRDRDHSSGSSLAGSSGCLRAASVTSVLPHGRTTTQPHGHTTTRPHDHTTPHLTSPQPTHNPTSTQPHNLTTPWPCAHSNQPHNHTITQPHKHTVRPCPRGLEGRGEASYLRVGCDGTSQRRDRPVFRAIHAGHLAAAASAGLTILGAAKQGRLALSLPLLRLLFGWHGLCRCIRQHGQ